jgi:hypothetical protein
MSNDIVVSDRINECSLEDLASNPAMLNAFAEMLRAADAAGYDPFRVDEIQNPNGDNCLEIFYKIRP